MNSESLDKLASEVEVTNISTHGIWLLLSERELFLPYEDFPWFKEVPIGNILKVEQPTPGALLLAGFGCRS